MMKQIVTTAMLGIALTLGGVGLAEGQGMMSHGSKQGAKKSEAHGMMGMKCPLMAENVDVKVEKLKDGAAIRITSADSKEVARIQKRTEIMRLLRELHQLEDE